jgi:hypothetical protein
MTTLFCGHDSGTFIIKTCEKYIRKIRNLACVSGQKLLKAIILDLILEKSTISGVSGIK